MILRVLSFSGEKDSHQERVYVCERVSYSPLISVVLLDIEGTTTPIDFVYKVLFPYARSAPQSFSHRIDSTWLMTSKDSCAKTPRTPRGV